MPEDFCRHRLPHMGGILSHILVIGREQGWKAIPRALWYRQRLKGLRTRILREYESSADRDAQEVVAFLKAHPDLTLPLGVTPPYEWVKDYEAAVADVAKDRSTGLWVATLGGNQVFFPGKFTLERVQQMIRIARMEQDPRSPHSYTGEGHDLDPGDVAVFVGASDGIFCLSKIERLSKAYLFEPDPDWVEPLKATMAPWADRVEVVQSALGSRDADGVRRLDTFLANRSEPNFIQMDVEGAEWDVLQGAQNLLSRARKLRLSICTYHRRLDYPRFAAYLGGLGYSISHSPGFYSIGVRRPYLRRGVLYASRGVSK